MQKTKTICKIDTNSPKKDTFTVFGLNMTEFTLLLLTEIFELLGRPFLSQPLPTPVWI